MKPVSISENAEIGGFLHIAIPREPARNQFQHSYHVELQNNFLNDTTTVRKNQTKQSNRLKPLTEIPPKKHRGIKTGNQKPLNNPEHKACTDSHRAIECKPLKTKKNPSARNRGSRTVIPCISKVIGITNIDMYPTGKHFVWQA